MTDYEMLYTLQDYLGDFKSCDKYLKDHFASQSDKKKERITKALQYFVNAVNETTMEKIHHV